MDFSKIRRVYFLGIGGIGMSALARYLYRSGVEVLGYDREQTELTKKLEAEGINIEYSTELRLAKGPIDVVIYTPAIKAGQREYEFFEEQGTAMLKRSEALELILAGKKVIAVAGTHGKTSTCALIAHICQEHDVELTAFVGGELSGYETNFFYGTSKWVLVEADEYDRSFWRLYPELAVINALDADHLDIYGTYQEMLEAYEVFTYQVHDGGAIFIADTAKTHVNGKWVQGLKTRNIALSFFGVGHAELQARSVEILEGSYAYELKGRKVKLNQPGNHNVYNSLAAIGICSMLGLKLDQIADSIETFKGIKRRYEYKYRTKDVVIIDDYAHHPVEIEKTIEATRRVHNDKILTVVFQPHLYSRTNDLKEGFAKALDRADEVILVDLYPAREQPIEGVSSQTIIELMEKDNKVYISNEKLVEHLKDPKRELILFMGAGDANNYIEELISAYN